ncbi:PREDICTED: bipolar kinesin KRP-130-like [Dufourea novaeangliae]|uniref:bipolar kinesin KRP-130-like n=1 Tax=Dufourea novaeangliae TaxID=178035 RepID=UPI000766F9C1|nr:PREDICTED: bipolar kinesin KRP-130-like [Dufourea novaeangliae]
MNDTRNGKKDRKQHIQVFVRVRPVNNAERAGKSITVVDTPSNREVVVRERPCDKLTKKFTFDRVFGSFSKQIEVYNAVACPLVEEVLAGYNCTVFAYGQTSTGKTFTMEGLDNDPSLHWQADTNAGIIPRSLSHLFDELRIIGVQDYSVRVSFLELYNEEVYDLLSSSNEAAKIRIYEDTTKKGAVIVHGLEEVTIYNKKDVFKILQKGSEKRQTAATLMNANSSRSHTIFSITVHIKENTIDGEELLKTGKLNLVDLAGSENIGRSGAIDKRAREAGSINQSLLTLGRVITALVEKTPHIPYRESKLTRLLQESLGGRTRTSIIATVSPASINLEETLSTLDYAHRAKNITNRPEINQKFSKKALLQEYAEEIEKLKKDLLATRERNGVYLAQDNYNEMQSLIDFQNKEIEEKLNHIKALEDTVHYKEQIFNQLKSKTSEQANELVNIKGQLETTTYTLMGAQSRLAISEQEKDEQKYLVEKHASTESVLLSQVQSVLDVVDTATTDVHKLHDKIYRKMQIGQQNSSLGQQIKNNLKERCRKIEGNCSSHADTMTQFYTSLNEYINAQTLSLSERIDKSIQDISDQFVNKTKNTTDTLTKNMKNSHLRYQEWIEKEGENVCTMAAQTYNIVNNVCSYTTQEIQQLIDNKIGQNLKDLNDDISQKIDNLMETAKSLIFSISNYSIKEHDRLHNNIQGIRSDIEDIRQSQTSIMERRCNFARMMENLQHSFNEVQQEHQETHSSICGTLNSIKETCNIINNETLNVNEIKAEKENNIEEKLQHDLETMKCVISEETEKLQIMSENSVVRGKAFISEFETKLNNNCSTLINYKNCVERNLWEMQRKMKEDQSLILSLINDVYTTVYNIGNERSRSLNSWKTAFTNACIEMSQKLETENLNTSTTNSRIIAEMHAIRNRVDKFFVEDLYRDVPTGLTPARKTFQYTKKLPKTSPPDRILNRYREALKELNSEENEEVFFGILHSNFH